jgi:hypothetical protein
MTHPSPIPDYAMPLKLVVIDTVDITPLHVMLPFSSTCLKKMPPKD